MIWTYAFCVAIFLAISSEASQQSGSQHQNHVKGYQEYQNNSQRVGSVNICSSCGCGLVKRSRIVGGENSQHSEFPWLAKLTHTGERNCGGTLISPSHILTAAHCVHNVGAAFLRIKLAGGKLRWSKSIHIHPSYNANAYEHDIAIVKIEAPVEFNGSVKRVCLPSEGQDFNGTTGIAAGWGRTKEDDKSNKDLHKIDLPIMSVDECAQSLYSAERLNKNTFCAGYMQGGRDTCQGDSGGPLYVRVNGHMVLAGIVSNGNGCARARYPGIYVKVINYLSWIRQNIGDECICINEN